MGDPQTLWSRYQKYVAVCPSIDLCLDISRMRFDDGFFDRMKGRMAAAFSEMAELEKGAIANPDENRMGRSLLAAKLHPRTDPGHSRCHRHHARAHHRVRP